MNIAIAKQVGTRLLGRSVLVLRKYSPEILTATGIVGVVGAAVLASKATLDLEPIVDTMNSRLATVNRYDSQFGDRNVVHDRIAVYSRGILDIVKLYAPAATTMALSIVSIVAAHGIMKRRNIAIAAAYKAMEGAFSKYRARVESELGGRAEELNFAMGEDRKETVNEDTGEKEVHITSDPTAISPYARFFDPLCGPWSETPSYNLSFLRAKQNYANALLSGRGHVFLNEVYDMLDIPRSKEGAVVGWISKNEGSEGDGYVDFGVYDLMNEGARAFVNGHEHSILLDFNVDGIVYDKL